MQICWAGFCLLMGIASTHFNAPRSPADTTYIVNIMILYIGYLVECGFAAGSLSQYLTAVRALHVDLSLPDPTANRAIRETLYAAKKWVRVNRPTVRKWPITPGMLRAYFKTFGDSHDELVVECSSVLAFTNLLRVSEYAATTGRGYAGVRRGDLTFSNELGSDGIPLALIVSMLQDKSGRLRFRFGQHFKHFRDPANPRCLVKKMWNLFRHDTRPDTAPLFAFANGAPLHRRHVKKAVQQMAKLSGRPENKFNTHSFRTGGAIAMAAAGCSLETIKTFGRWRSDCVRIYLSQTDIAIHSVHAAMWNAPETGIDYAMLQDKLFSYSR